MGNKAPAFKTKREYQTAISQYKAKRDQLTRRYRQQSRTITARIKIWERAVRRIAEREEKIRQADLLVAGFSGFQVKKGITLKTPAARKLLYKRLFARYTLENGCQSKEVSAYMGYSTGYRAAFLRSDFIRLAQTDPAYRDAWARFKQYLKDKNN